MAEGAENPVTAHDVLLRVLDTNPAITIVRVVLYEESKNWRDLVPDGRPSSEQLSLAIRQDPHPRSFIELSRAQLLDGSALELQRQLVSRQLMGVTSSVNIDPKQRMHIPMMDFSCSPSEQRLGALRNMLREIGQRRGFILESGRSYHYYGVDLLDEERWRAFLGKCLLMKDFVDERYVGHQLVDGYCVLRLSASPLKPKVPTVATEL